jgi:hypothetical protein
MNHRFQNICPLYKDISGRSQINAKIKIPVRTFPTWGKTYMFIIDTKTNSKTTTKNKAEKNKT